MLDVKNKKILVVGGGKIGTRKIFALLEEEAIVTCVSPNFTNELLRLDNVLLKEKLFEKDDILSYFLVIAATDDVEVNEKIYTSCKEEKILCQTVDSVNYSDFDFLASKKLNNLLIAVSTYGKAPGYAKCLASKLANSLTAYELEELEKEIEKRKGLLNKKY